MLTTVAERSPKSHRSNARYPAVGRRYNEVRIGGRLPLRIAKEESHEGSQNHEHQGYRPEAQNEQENAKVPGTKT